jgi:hypothetical protein
MRSCAQWIAPSAAKGLRPAAAAFCSKTCKFRCYSNIRYRPACKKTARGGALREMGVFEGWLLTLKKSTVESQGLPVGSSLA